MKWMAWGPSDLYAAEPLHVEEIIELIQEENEEAEAARLRAQLNR